MRLRSSIIRTKNQVTIENMLINSCFVYHNRFVDIPYSIDLFNYFRKLTFLYLRAIILLLFYSKPNSDFINKSSYSKFDKLLLLRYSIF